jgi:myo-inositol-1(or 4)-monophosphatase
MTELLFIRKLMEQLRPLALSLIAEMPKVEQKADGSPVTEIDQKLERFIREAIQQEYPEDGITGEEYGAHQPEAARQWVIDPIDGTRNLVSGIPLYTCLIAFCVEGTIKASAMMQPVTGELWLSNRVQTEFCVLPDQQALQKQSVNKVDNLSEAIFATTSPYLFRQEDQPKIANICHQARSVIWGGDAYGYGKLASGKINLIVESGLDNYDFAALIPILEGAGAIVTDWQGEAITLVSGGDIIAASSKALHEQAMALLND